ncbi:BQ2448_6312 [Microbotryum intermedium]|uniref:BQ2448_6312 protein n=1 Tax=Microbotryum intermedium TaxID=269621 RepID=A0A238FJC3_9BASI|nr:BQ2448_6312 [Microbotryum intermedium]
MATTSTNNINNNALPLETLQYRTQLSYLLAPLSNGQFATQPHLINTHETNTTPDHYPSTTTLRCPACQAALIVGVNAVARIHRTSLRQRCLGCHMVSNRSGGEMKGVMGLAQGKDRFLSVKQRKKKRRKLEVSGSQDGNPSLVGTNSRKLTTTTSMSVHDVRMQDVESTTSTGRVQVVEVRSTVLPSSMASPTQSISSPPSNSITPNPVEPKAKPPPQPTFDTNTHNTDASSKPNTKRSKISTKTKGLAELLAAKKLEREKANQQAAGGGGAMGLQQFLQSM